MSRPKSAPLVTAMLSVLGAAVLLHTGEADGHEYNFWIQQPAGAFRLGQTSGDAFPFSRDMPFLDSLFFERLGRLLEPDAADTKKAVFHEGLTVYGLRPATGEWKSYARDILHCPNGNICSPACNGPGGRPLLSLDQILPVLSAILEAFDALPDPPLTNVIWLDPTLHPISAPRNNDTNAHSVYPAFNCDGWTTGSKERYGVIGYLMVADNEGGNKKDLVIDAEIVDSCSPLMTLSTGVYLVCAGEAPEDLTNSAKRGRFEAPIRVALQGESSALAPERISTLPIPLPGPEFLHITRIGNLFKQIGIALIEARSSLLNLDWEPPDPPDPPNRKRQILNSLERALLISEELKREIESARQRGVLSPEWAEELLSYQGSLADLISAIPINLP